MIHTARGRRGPHIVVPDDPWSTIYRPAAVRAVAEAFELGAGDEEAWRVYLDTGNDEPEAVRALTTASKVYGKRMRKPRAKRSGAAKL